MYYLSLSPVIIIIFHYSGLGQLIVAFYMNVTTVINRDEKLASVEPYSSVLAW